MTPQERIAELEAKLETANALVTCCCGNPVDTHSMGDGQSPVDMYHYNLLKLTEERDKLREYYEAHLVIRHIGLFNASDEEMARFDTAAAALDK